MAERTANTVKIDSVGSLILSSINIQEVDDRDTYDSGIREPISYWANATNDPTMNREGVMVGYNEAVNGTIRGRFTFFASQGNRITTNLYILHRT